MSIDDKINCCGIKITAEKKQIKNMYIKVIPPDGKVKITAPISASDDAIQMFAVSRISWIKKQQKNFAEQLRQTERSYVTGENYYLWRKRYRLDVMHSNVRNDVFISGQKTILQVRKDSTVQQRANIMDSWYRDILKKAVPPIFEKCEKLVGITANEWKTKNMRTK